MPEMFDNSAPRNTRQKEHNYTGLFAGLVAGLLIALGGVGYLAVRNSQLSGQIAQMQTDTQSQISKLSAATTSLLEDRLQSVTSEIDAVKSNEEKTSTAVRQTRAQAQKQNEELHSKLEEQQKATSDQIAELKDSTNTSITAVSTDVNSVKSDVGGVRSDVTAVRTDLGTTQTNLENTSAELKRAVGDMGVMSGLIATNAKDLAALRALGERNYVEFDISRKDAAKKVGDVSITLKKADTGRNRYTVSVFADDKLVEKRDRTINEPVQLYIGNSRFPYEIVVNQVKKDEIVGYLSTPKVTVARN